MLKKICIISVIIAISIFCIGCSGKITPAISKEATQVTNDKPWPAYSGKKIKVQITEFGIPKDLAEKYKELQDKRVGWGLCNRLMDSFDETNRFIFVEDKEETQKKANEIIKIYERGESKDVLKSEGKSLAQYIIYAEVFDFAVSHAEKNIGADMKKEDTTIIGIQIKVVDVVTNEVIPSSGTGTATTSSESTWMSMNVPFDQSTVGIATQRAIKNALGKIVDKMEKRAKEGQK